MTETVTSSHNVFSLPPLPPKGFSNIMEGWSSGPFRARQTPTVGRFVPYGNRPTRDGYLSYTDKTHSGNRSSTTSIAPPRTQKLRQFGPLHSPANYPSPATPRRNEPIPKRRLHPHSPSSSCSQSNRKTVPGSATAHCATTHSNTLRGPSVEYAGSGP